jgi:hypothetical protein
MLKADNPTSRRRLLTAAAAIAFAATPTTVATAVSVADPLVEQHERWQQLAEIRTDNDEEVERLSAVLTDIETEIATTPATTAAGYWAKIKVVAHYSAACEREISDDLVASLLEDSERLIGDAT